MSNNWIIALKKWNRKEGGKYKIPSKGTKEYLEVKKIQKKLELKGNGKTPPFPLLKITEEERDKAFQKLRDLKCDKILNLSNIGNKASNYYFQKYRFKTKIGNWSFISAWKDEEKRKKILEIDKKINRDYKNVIGTTRGIHSALRMSIGSINQFKPYIAICGVYNKFKPKRVLDTSAGWGDRLVGAMAKDIDYIGIDQNKNLKKPYREMIKNFKKISNSNIIMIFKKSQNVNYSKLPPYDMIFTSPPYFDLEKYEGMEIFKNKEEFINLYWKPTIKEAFKYLEKGGYMCLNMPEEMYTALLDIIGKSNSKIKMPIQNRFNWKNKKPRFEYIYVWRKM